MKTSLIQIDDKIDESYFKDMIEDIKRKQDLPSWAEQRASMMSNDSTYEGTL